MKDVLLYLLLTIIAPCLSAENWEYLLDKDISKFEVWIGPPHHTVQGLPFDIPKTNDGMKGKPLGLNNDIKKVFSTMEENGELILRVTGEIYGALSTISEYENYHLSLKMKWGEKKWEPRLNELRDSGILYHCHGEHGTFWQSWKACIEYQVQETDLGDLYCLGGTLGDVRSSKKDSNSKPIYNPESESYFRKMISAFPEPDAPHGEWNHLEIYTIGRTGIHMVNGEVVLVVENMRRKNKEPLFKGQIQIQSEAAECYYKDIKIRNINTFPEAIHKKIRLATSQQ